MLTRPDSSPPESALGTTPALPPGGGRRMSKALFGFHGPFSPLSAIFADPSVGPVVS
ncbi:hypothetical protein H180DRAFT_04246 [Streptomyces sp. WMMB 322]|nr:hypothetical protein H180DRAFT_04246 [Streptomyces sp. WMMB 322]